MHSAFQFGGPSQPSGQWCELITIIASGRWVRAVRPWQRHLACACQGRQDSCWLVGRPVSRPARRLAWASHRPTVWAPAGGPSCRSATARALVVDRLGAKGHARAKAWPAAAVWPDHNRGPARGRAPGEEPLDHVARRAGAPAARGQQPGRERLAGQSRLGSQIGNTNTLGGLHEAGRHRRYADGARRGLPARRVAPASHLSYIAAPECPGMGALKLECTRRAPSLKPSRVRAPPPRSLGAPSSIVAGVGWAGQACARFIANAASRKSWAAGWAQPSRRVDTERNRAGGAGGGWAVGGRATGWVAGRLAAAPSARLRGFDPAPGGARSHTARARARRRPPGTRRARRPAVSARRRHHDPFLSFTIRLAPKSPSPACPVRHQQASRVARPLDNEDVQH